MSWREFTKWCTHWYGIFRRLDDSQTFITRNFLRVSFVAVLISTIIYALLVAFASTGWGLVVSTISLVILSVSTSVLAAAIVEISGRMRARDHFENRQKIFRQFFSADLDRPVAIVLPKLPTKADQSEQDEFRAPVKAPDNFSDWVSLRKVNKTIVLSDQYFAAFSDIAAASYLIAAFAENKLPTPEILWDQDAIQIISPQGEVNPNSKKYQTYITIGLFSNEVTAWVNEKAEEQRLFAIQYDQHDEDNLHTYQRVLFARLDQPKKFWSSSQLTRVNGALIDHAVFGKIPTSDGITVIVCGGIQARGTKKLGYYIGKQWEHLALKTDKRGEAISHRDVPFAFAFDVIIQDEHEGDNILADISDPEIRIGSS